MDQILASEKLPSTANDSRLLRSSLEQSHVISGSSSPSVSSSTLISNSSDCGHLYGAFHGNSSHRGSYTSSRGYNSRGSSSHGSHGGGGSRGGYSRGGGSVPCGDRKCTHCGSSGQNISRHYSNFSRHYSSL
ncbi:dermokine-like [Camellia sinensis]|uniref:dermokine-like n=1 Tax=Camellia sinensis TaxID=4442 RepID=UPI0010361636|nr:dermokine-like [Camellia sinensis]